MADVEQLVRRCLCAVTERPEGQAATLDLSRDLFDYYGLTSLNLVMLVTAICEEGGIALTSFTEKDIAGFKTPRHIVDTVTRVGEAEQARHGMG